MASPVSHGGFAERASGRDTLTLALFGAATLAAVLALWVVPYVPTNDGPNHILQAYLSSHWRDPAKGYASFVEPAMPVTGLAFHALCAPLVRLLEWRLALRLTLSVGVLGWCLGYLYLVRALDARRSLLALAAPATALAWSFYMGFWGFWMSSGASLFLLGFALRHPRPTLRHRLVIALGLGALSVGHSFAAALAAFALFGFVLVRHAGRERARQLGLLVLSAAPAVVVAVLSTVLAKQGWELDQLEGEAFAAEWISVSDRVTVLWRCFVGGPAWRALPLVLLALASLVFAVRAALRRRLGRADLAVLVAALAVGSGALVSPWSVNAWQVLPPRFLPLATLLLLSLLPVERIVTRVVPSRCALVLGFGLSLSSVAWTAAHHVRLFGEASDALEAASQPLRRTGPRLPIILVPDDTAMMRVSPHVNVGNILVLEQGGMTPHLFATVRGLHPFVFVRPRAELFPPYTSRFQAAAWFRAGIGDISSQPEQLAWMALLGRAYEDVIVWAEGGAVDELVDRGYAVDWRGGDVAILRPAPCGLGVLIDVRSGPRTEPEPAPEVSSAGDDGARGPAAPTVIASALLVQYGPVPIEQKVEMAVFPEGSAFPTGEAVVRFDALCGPAWVRPFWDLDRSGKAGPRDLFCEGADEKGRLFVTVGREASPVRCRAAPQD